MKRCSKCKSSKDVPEFNKDANNKDGHRYECRSCQYKSKQDYLERKKMTMNQSKYEAKHKGLNSALRKVFDATPVAESWAATAISAEMRRRGTGGVDSRATLGCLNSLVDTGLIEEVSKGHFQRVEAREKPAYVECRQTVIQTIPKEPAMQNQHITIKPTPSNPIDKLSKLASRLRELANDMETAALELAEQAEKNDSETVKMRQLQALLKSLG